MRASQLNKVASRTNCDGLYPDTFLDVCVGWVIIVSALEDCLTAEGVDECGAS